MTTTEAAPAPTTPRRRPNLRWRRMWAPVAVAATLIVFTLIAALIESPSPGNDTFLSPRASGGDGSSRLADSLEDRGVAVERFTDASDAFAAATTNPTTVFIPAPEFLNTSERSALATVLKTPGTRIVFVAPSRDMLTSLGLHKEGSARIAPKVVAPGGKCGLAAAEKAGDAGMLRQTYAKTDFNSELAPDVDWRFCYDNGLAWTSADKTSLVVAGASDPFTDEHFGEAGNAEATTELLGQHDSVVWLDKHSLVTPPPPTDPSGDLPTDEPSPSDSRDRIDYPGAAPTDPIYDALPSWLWAGLLGVIVLGILMALWKGRRLGPPVAEPLPVTVPAAETVHGRARLYRRAHAYGEAVRALRAGALYRIRPVLGLSSQATDAEVVQAVANRTGWPSDQVVAALYGTQPSNENDLFDATRAVDALVAAVENASPSGGRSNE